MRQAADILSSAPAMQIRYLEAMQAMAKSANSKVIFLPAQNQTIPINADTLAAADSTGKNGKSTMHFDDSMDNGFQQAINARVIENI